MTEADRWRLNHWGAVRVSALSATAVRDLRFEHATELALRLNEVINVHDLRRQSLINKIYLEIGGCEDRVARRWLLGAKRDLFNGRELRWPSPPELAGSISTELVGELESFHEIERELEEAGRSLDAVYESELDEVRTRLERHAADSSVISGLVLSNPDLALAVQRLGQSRRRLSPRRQESRAAALARYVSRAATRTTPFGRAAATALVPIESRKQAPDSETVEWRIRYQLNLANLMQWLERNLSVAVVERLPLRVNPLHAVRDEGLSLEVPDVGPAFPRHFSDWMIRGVTRVRVTDSVRAVLDVADGRSMAEILDLLATSDDERDEWCKLLDQLLEAGILERIWPRPSVDTSGLGGLSRQVEILGDPDTAQRLKLLSERVCSASDPELMIGLVRDVANEFGPGASPPIMYQDTFLEGINIADTGLEPSISKKTLEPVLHLAASTLSTEHHQLIVDAFVARYGTEGTCENVAGFLMSLIQEPGFMARLRTLNPTPSWFSSPLGEHVRHATGSRVVLDPELFDTLPRAGHPGSISVFVQVAECGDEPRLVLNGVQSGRHKYLSRYLEERGRTSASLCNAMRTSLADDSGPRPVEIAPLLGLNFQLHPPLTQCAIEIPFEPSSGHDITLPLSDLRLTYDPSKSRLRLWSCRLGVEIEPIHLGFLRDSALPDELLLLRLLSSRFGDETLAERIDLYNFLDWADIMSGGSPVPHRPRLEVGRLILERERWAVPLSDVPRPLEREARPAFFAQLQRWRLGCGLPERGFARVLNGSRMVESAAAPRFYVDWTSPFVLSWLGLRGNDIDQSGWLIFTELMPDPEKSLLRLAGRPHAAEVVIQFDRCADE